ncbi:MULTISPECIES: hypothetical protein [unclassified Acidovorax]|uniref:hypothetical protein n=1 Tax=unclassified Acidovorax TaxID=2684926 RepID=UPI001C49251A|nr:MULTISPECIES: hypothetical protein [unclassified Acidovorax]MBV7459493.1 hypothetical protein [Acidovorax sp. sif0632]MBV7464518.1 hypothetical protein [Acidovorax sp. sif0613]
MAIKYVQRPFTIKVTNGSSATDSEETGTTNDGRIVAARTVTDDGAGNLANGLGTVNYVGKTVVLKVVSFDRSTTAYKSDYDDAVEFERTVTDGEGSSNSNARKGGEYGTASVGEEVLAASTVIARYRVGASAPATRTQALEMPPMAIDLAPYTTDSIVPGSVQFRWMGQIYSDFEGVVYRDRTDVSAGIASGRLDYAAGVATMTGWVVGGTGPTDFQLLSLWTQKGQWSTASLFFSTDMAPLRPGPGGFVLSVVDLRGDTLTANVDNQGAITGAHMRGKVEFSRGGVELQFGDFVLDADLTAADKTEWWYSAADVGAVQAGRIWRPWPVDPTTLRYSAVSFIYLPVDITLMGLDPAALPADGRVAYARPGDLCVIGVLHGGVTFVPTVGHVYDLGAERLSFAQVIDAVTQAEIYTGYTADLDGGTVTFNDLTGYPAGGVKVLGRTEVYRQIAEVRIDGKVRLTQPVGYGFPVGAVFSTALRFGDRFARVSRVYDQASWNGTTWYDGVDPSKGEAVGTFASGQHPIVVTNRGAITERWALRFRSDGQVFDLIGQRFGQIASGNINADFSPMNLAAGAPYMTVPSSGWGSGWVSGNVLFIDTIGAEAAIDCVRCTQPGSPVGIDDSAWLVQRGDVARDPGSSFD